MPVKYVAEMFCDRVAACKTYRGKNYCDRDPYDYYMRSVGHYLIHPNTAALLAGYAHGPEGPGRRGSVPSH